MAPAFSDAILFENFMSVNDIELLLMFIKIEPPFFNAELLDIIILSKFIYLFILSK
jgi:hypothetical protein